MVIRGANVLLEGDIFRRMHCYTVSLLLCFSSSLPQTLGSSAILYNIFAKSNHHILEIQSLGE